jgi:hypothetical protein
MPTNPSAQPDEGAQATSVYFADGALLVRLDALSKKVRLSRNLVIARIVEAALPDFEKKPARLIDLG